MPLDGSGNVAYFQAMSPLLPPILKSDYRDVPEKHLVVIIAATLLS